MNNLNNPILLFRRHLIIARQAQSSSENIRADIHACTGYIRIALSASVSLYRNKRMIAINRLHVHWLPNRTALRIYSLDGIKYLLRATFAANGLIQVIMVSSDHRSHGFFIDNHAGQPKIRAALFPVPWIHLNRQILKTCFISLIYRTFLCYMLFKIRNLSSDNARDDITHSIVVTDFLMLIPRCILTALCRPLANLIGIFKAVCQEHSSGTACYDFISIEGNAVHDQDEISLSAGAYKVVIDAYHQQASFDIQIVNGYKIEAENILFTSTTSKNDYVRIRNEEDEAYITQNNSTGHIRPIADETALLASGGSYLGDILSGNIIDFYFYSAIQETAEIAIRASSCYMSFGDGWTPKIMSDEQVNRLFDAYANGEKIAIDDDVILPGKGDKDSEIDMSLWVNWQTVSFGLMSLTKGWNTISLKITSDYVNYLGYGCSFNLDYLSVNFVD